jgi:antitoxin HicB
MKYHFKIHKEGSKYWAECLELEGCNTQGDTRAGLIKNMSEALHLYLDEPEDSRLAITAPNPTLKGKNIVEIAVEPRVAWATSLRNSRLNRGMTQKEAAKSLNMKSIFAYQRLESGKTANPELATIVRVKRVFPELDIDDLISA